MEERPVGADSIRPNPRISGSTQVNIHATVGVDEYVDPYRALRRTGSIFHSSNDTPSVSPFGLPAPPEVEPRALRARVQQHF